MATTTTTTATKAPTTLKAASSQPATGVGSLAETNRLLSQAATKTSTSTSSGKDTLPAGIAYQTYNPDGSVRSSQTFAQKSASDKAAVANGTDTAPGIGGELTNQVVPSSAPINTAQPSPSTVNATPYTNPVSDAQAQQNLAQRGLTGGDLAVAQNSLSAAQQGHAAATAGNVPVPQDAGTGVSAATTAMANASTNYVSPAPVVQAYSDATKKLTDDYNQSMSSEGQGKSLVDQYKQFTKDLGIPQLNTELMNMKNIIDGTEDDIRNEVTKAGGFATDSQVLAMTNARNKTMIQNYNNLLQTRSDAMQQVQTMVGLAGQDREYLSKQIDRQLNFDQQQVTFAEKALTNAQSSIQKSIDTYGAASVYKQALATGDPTAVARLNATMSASGSSFDLKQASLAPPSLDEQLKKAQISNIYSEISARNNPADKPQTAVQAQVNGYADRIAQANIIVNKLGGNFTSKLAVGGSLPNILQSGDRQSYEQAKKNFVTAVLRRESGASIAPSEFKDATAIYFPVAGDTKEQVAQKAATRNTVINNFYREANVPRPVSAGDIVQGSDGNQYRIGDDGITLKPL